MRLNPRAVQTYVRDAAGAFEKAPVEVAIGIVLALVFSVTTRRHDDDSFMRAAVSAGLSLPLVFALSVLHARGAISAAARWAGSAAVVVAALAYGQLVFHPDREAEGWRFAALLGAAVMALVLAAFPGAGDRAHRRARVWRFDVLLLARIVTVVAYGAALYAALAGAVAAVSSLFELETPEHLYSDLAGAVFFALVPWVVVGGIPELVEEPAVTDERAPRAVRLLGRYLYAPVLVVYLAILLAYTVKVLVTGEAPKNLLSPIILLAGFFGFLGSVLLEPLRRDPDHPGVARLIRVFPALLLVLLPMAVWAVWVRRDQYGWTEFRYLRFALLLALGVLAVAGVVRLARRREPLLVTIPAVLGATLLLASFGPWGATAVSKRSQLGRLRSGLREVGMLRDGRYTGPLVARDEQTRLRRLPRDQYDRIAGSVAYLHDAHGPGSLRGIFANPQGFDNGWALASALPFQAGCPTEGAQVLVAEVEEQRSVPVAAGGELYAFQWADTATRRIRTRGGEVTMTMERDGIRIRGAGWDARVDLRPMLAGMRRGSARDCSPGGPGITTKLAPERAVHDVVDAAGVRRGQLVLTRLVYQVPGRDGEERRTAGEREGLTSYNGTVVIFPDPAPR